MIIGNRALEFNREPQRGGFPENSAGRPGSVTSNSSGNSTGISAGTTIEINGKGVASNANQPPGPIDVKNAVEKLNDFVQSQKTEVSFSVDKDAETTVIKVFKSETGELIRQYPPDEILAMKARINHTLGLLYDVKM